MDGVLSRQRRQHWLHALIRNIKFYLGLDFESGYLEGFYELLHQGKVPIARTG
jgi:hypothetical protein